MCCTRPPELMPLYCLQKSLHSLFSKQGYKCMHTMLVLVCVCTRPSLTQTLQGSWYSLLSAHHTGELFTVVIGTTWQSYSAFCFHVIHEGTISVMLVFWNSLRVFVQTDKHGASFMASMSWHVVLHASPYPLRSGGDCVIVVTQRVGAGERD